MNPKDFISYIESLDIQLLDYQKEFMTEMFAIKPRTVSFNKGRFRFDEVVSLSQAFLALKQKEKVQNEHK